MKVLFQAAFALALVAGPVVAFAAELTTPVGTWKNIDDKTGEAKALIQITESGGKLEGKIIKLLKSDDGPNPVCKECDGERKNKPIEGMTILWGLSKDGDEWNGGQILDPKNGKIYKVKMTLDDGGRKLNVRAFIGFSLMGRSQVWLRQE